MIKFFKFIGNVVVGIIAFLIAYGELRSAMDFIAAVGVSATIGLVVFLTFFWVIGKGFVVVYKSYFTDEYELIRQIRHKIKKQTGEVVDIEVVDGEIMVTRYFKNEDSRTFRYTSMDSEMERVGQDL